jgi:threonylcarbamoyladenosine tRNA methylthiotransferase MtaB
MSGLEIITFGCRLNAFESEVIRGAAAAAGLEDAVVVNTCAVTEEAERQARQAIRRARRERPNARIIVTGCAATLAPERYAALDEVDLVLDNTAKLRPGSYEWGSPRLMEAEASDPLSTPRTWEARSQPSFSLSRDAGKSVREQSLGTGESRRARAYLQVQQGCDHRCTFCIIPYARGPSRSVPLNAIVGQARDLVLRGTNEVVLTGVDLTAYGLDLPDRPSLGNMVRRLLDAVPSLHRLRLSSLDPSEIDEDLWQLVATERRLMPHLHLSIQAGDDLILKRMKRRHSRAQAITAARRAHTLRPEILLGADLIAGFPTETETMFRNTSDLIAECGLTFVHVFPYSSRPGTPAALMPQLAPAIIRERAARLREAAASALKSELARRVGQVEDVLIEAPGNGRAACYASVRFDAAPAGETAAGGPAAIGSVRRMRFIASGASHLIGVPA